MSDGVDDATLASRLAALQVEANELLEAMAVIDVLPTVVALLDRLCHHVHMITADGDS